MDCCTLGLPVFPCLPEFVQIHVHWVGDAIQPSHLLSPSSPPALEGLFQWVGSSHQMAKVVELQLQHQSFQWISRTNYICSWLCQTEECIFLQRTKLLNSLRVKINTYFKKEYLKSAYYKLSYQFSMKKFPHRIRKKWILMTHLQQPAFWQRFKKQYSHLCCI